MWQEELKFQTHRFLRLLISRKHIQEATPAAAIPIKGVMYILTIIKKYFHKHWTLKRILKGRRSMKDWSIKNWTLHVTYIVQILSVIWVTWWVTFLAPRCVFCDISGLRRVNVTCKWVESIKHLLLVARSLNDWLTRSVSHCKETILARYQTVTRFWCDSKII